MLHVLINQFSIDGSQLIADTGDNMKEFALHMFARQEFSSRLLERSFRQPIGWMELALCLALMGLTFLLSKYLIKTLSGRGLFLRWRFLGHIRRRILWPILMLVFSVIALYFWHDFGFQAVWLRLLVMAARWMIIIRFFLAVIHGILPRSRLSDRIEKVLATSLWIAFMVWVSGIDDIAIHWMKSLQIPIGSINLNLYTILTGILWIGVIMVLAMWFARFVEGRIMNNARMDMNSRIMLSKIIKSVLAVLSILIALPLVGIDLTVLSVFGGALGVGVGFGLQKIASNYISGFIILGDRSIRPGDRLTVEDFTGYVTKITSRFVVLRSTAGAEALIPNETFVTSTVINESYTGKALWQSLDVQVAYHTDLALALQILEEAAADQERVADEPAPSAFLRGFGDNGVDLSIGFWVKDPENGFLGLFSAILLDIWRRFKENNIEFPFPQPEVRILNNEQQKPSELAMLRAALKAKDNTDSNEPASEAGED